MKKSVDEIIKDIDAILSKATAECTNALRPLSEQPPKPDQAYACLELFHMQNYELVYNAFYVRNGQLDPDYACHPDFKGEKSFVPALTTYIRDLASSQELTQSEGEEFTGRHEKQFLAWLKECWTGAGGKQAKTPTYFCFEKEYRVQDIFTGTVMEEDEAARLLGFKV